MKKGLFTLTACSTFALGSFAAAAEPSCRAAKVEDNTGIERVVINALDGGQFASTTSFNGVTKTGEVSLEGLPSGRYLLTIYDLSRNSSSIEYSITEDASGRHCRRLERKRQQSQAPAEVAPGPQQPAAAPPTDDEAVGCYAKQYVDESILPAVRHARLVRERLDQFRKGKRNVQEGYQVYRMYFTILKVLATTVGQASSIQSYDQEDKYRNGIVALIPGLMAKNPELKDTTVAGLISESATVEAEYTKLTRDHRELMNDPAASWGRSVVDLELARYDDRKLSAADVSPEGLFPCLAADKRKEAMEMLNFSLEMDFGQVVGADRNLNEMNDRLKEYRAGKRPPREGYIILWLLGQEYSSLYSTLHNGASHHPYEQETARVMRYRVQTDPKLAQFTPENLKKKILANTKELDSLVQKHPDLSQVKEFGLNMLQYVKP